MTYQTIKIQGHEEIIEARLNTETGVAYLIYSCIACGENDVDERGTVCPGCVMRTMRFVAVRDAINHLLANDDAMRAVIDYDNAMTRRARDVQMPFVDIRSGAHDTYVQMGVDNIVEEINDIANAIAVVMHNAPMCYGDDVVV